MIRFRNLTAACLAMVLSFATIGTLTAVPAQPQSLAPTAIFPGVLA